MKSFTSTSSLAKSFSELENTPSGKAETEESLMPHAILIVPASRGATGESAARNIADYIQHEVGLRVLLVDGRLSQMASAGSGSDSPDVEPGFGEIIMGNREDVFAMLVQDGINDWQALPAGNASGRLSHRKIREAYQYLLEQIGERFDYVIIHTLEPEECPVAIALAGVVDLASICVEDRKTNASTMKNAWDLMKNHEASRLSIILEKRPPEWLAKLYRKIQEKLPFNLPFEL